MKRFSPLLAVFAAGLAAASFATASPPPGKGPGHGKHHSTTSGQTTSGTLSCHPIVSTILKGTFTAGGGTSFTMNVTHANHHGQALMGSQTITVDSSTKFRRNGPATLADFTSGDRLLVQARTCKTHHGEAASSNAPTAPLLAKRVVGHPAKSSGASGENESGSTTTSTTP